MTKQSLLIPATLAVAFVLSTACLTTTAQVRTPDGSADSPARSALDDLLPDGRSARQPANSNFTSAEESLPASNYVEHPGRNPYFAVQFPPGTAAPGRNDPRGKSLQALNAVRDRLKAAKDDDQKAAARSAAREALVDYFGVDLKQRQEELRRLTERADATAELLQKRAAAKDELIDLQLKSFTYDANGLGLFSEQSSRQPGAAAGRNNPFAAWARTVDLVHQGAPVDPLKEAFRSVEQARDRLQTASSDEDRETATDNLRKALATYFDQDMSSRRKELHDVRSGLNRMTSSLDKRLDSMDDIIDLQLRMLVNESEGLGFFRGANESTSRQRVWAPRF